MFKEKKQYCEYNFLNFKFPIMEKIELLCLSGVYLNF